MSRRLALALLLALAASAAHAQTKPVLTISFDNDLNGVGAQGPVAGIPQDTPALEAGKFGKALKSGPGTGYVEYPTTGIINPLAGTVEMWVCPLDWSPGDEEFHCFFDARGEGALYLYKYHQGVRLLMLTCENVAGPYFSAAAELAWKPGEWHHIAGTWSADGVMCYADGQPARKLPIEGALPTALGPRFRIGDHPWHLPRKSSSLIDEVRIYDRALTAAHIAAHHQGRFDFAAPLKPESLILRHDIDPERQAVNVRLSTGGADVEDGRLGVKLALARNGETLADSTPMTEFSGGCVRRSLPMVSTQPGQYALLARVYLDGKQIADLPRDVIIPSTEWRGNTLGLEDKVLPPWTPMEFKDNTARCWGREYAFGSSPFPRQIRSAGKDLLARPISLRVKKDGNALVWKPETPTARLSPAQTRVEVAGPLSDNVLQFHCRTTIEYDGLALVELSLPQSQALRPESLSVEIPLKTEHAVYRHRWARAWAGVTGHLPAGEGAADTETFIPYYWLGDNDRGLFWFCESDEMWPNGQNPHAIEVVRAGGEVVLRLNLLAAGQTLPPDWKFVFGLQATPVKPLPKDWRKWRLQPGRNANVSIIWPTPAKDSLRYFGYPEAADPPLFTERLAGLREKNVRAVPYLCLSFLSAACPEWPYFRERWAMGPVDTGSSDVAAYGVGFAMVSPVGKDYADFIVWKTRQFIDRYGIDGLYHDNTHPYGSAQAACGLGYERDGKLHPTYPILGYRALYRRMYAVMKSADRETFTMAHMSGKVAIPILAYEDAYLDGEHFRGRVKDSYMDLLPLDTFRAEFMGRQWGIMPFFLPEFPSDLAKAVEPTRGLMGLLMIHDVSPWPIWCNAAVMNEALDALDEFGYVDADFVPYFDPAPPATTDMKDVYVSAYTRPGRALLIAANLSRENREGNVRINADRLGLAGDSPMSWPDKKPLPLTDKALRLDVPRLGYRMIVVEK